LINVYEVGFLLGYETDDMNYHLRGIPGQDRCNSLKAAEI
jgi:hypothetical protein